MCHGSCCRPNKCCPYRQLRPGPTGPLQQAGTYTCPCIALLCNCCRPSNLPNPTCGMDLWQQGHQPTQLVTERQPYMCIQCIAANHVSHADPPAAEAWGNRAISLASKRKRRWLVPRHMRRSSSTVCSRTSLLAELSSRAPAMHACCSQGLLHCHGPLTDPLHHPQNSTNLTQA